jgi:hypothetical protein
MHRKTCKKVKESGSFGITFDEREFNEVKESIVYSVGPLLLLYNSEYFQPVNKRQTAGHQMALKLGNW